MEKTSICVWLALTAMVMSCDSNTEELEHEFVVSILQSNALTGTDAVNIGQFTVSKNAEIDLSRFPLNTHDIKGSRYSYGWSRQDIPADLIGSVFIMFNPVSLPPKIVGVNPEYFPSFSKQESDIELEVYAFIVEKAGVAYPEEINVVYKVNDEEYSLTVNSSQHMIRLNEQVIFRGGELGNLPSAGGIKYDMRYPEQDTMLFPVLLSSNLENMSSINQQMLETLSLVGYRSRVVPLAESYPYILQEYV